MGEVSMEKYDSLERGVPRKRSAYLLVNTIKWGLYLELPVLIGRFAWSNKFNFATLSADFIGFFLYTLFFSLVVGYIASLNAWAKIEKEEAKKS
jgi:hypothetical protein